MIKFILGILFLIIVAVAYILGLRTLHLDLLETFTSEASGAAFGGFIGGLFVWSMREVYVHWRKRPKHVVTYFVADNKEEIYGKLLHHRGERVLNKDEIKKVLGDNVNSEVISNGLWEYKLTADHLHKNKAAFYGPYTYDLTEPGTYEASFHYYGRGFEEKKEENPMLFHVDVVLKQNIDEHLQYYDDNAQLIPVQNKHIGQKKVIIKGKKHLYYKDFIADKKKEANSGRVMKLRFYYDGVGDFEFRAYVPDQPDTAFGEVVTLLGKGCRVFFFKVEINQVFAIEIPEAI